MEDKKTLLRADSRKKKKTVLLYWQILRCKDIKNEKSMGSKKDCEKNAERSELFPD